MAADCPLHFLHLTFVCCQVSVLLTLVMYPVYIDASDFGKTVLSVFYKCVKLAYAIFCAAVYVHTVL